jgi:hypothetical protein
MSKHYTCNSCGQPCEQAEDPKLANLLMTKVTIPNDASDSPDRWGGFVFIQIELQDGVDLCANCILANAVSALSQPGKVTRVTDKAQIRKDDTVWSFPAGSPA